MQGGPRRFSQSSTSSDLLDRRCSAAAYRTVTFCGRPFQTVRLTSQRRMARSHGLIRVRSPLLAESRLISFPPGTEMFQFPGFARPRLCIQRGATLSGCPAAPGCPIRRSPDHSLFGGSPGHIAAYNVLHRLCTPRHPPCTLSSLTAFGKRCGPSRLSMKPPSGHAPPRPFGPHGSPPKGCRSDTQASTMKLSKISPAALPAADRGKEIIAQPAARQVEPTGIEPATSALQTRRSPN